MATQKKKVTKKIIKKKPVGRPKRMLDTLWKDWQNDVLDLYKEGSSNVEIKGLIYVKTGSFSNDLWDRWIEEEDEFSETIKAGKILSECWWNKKGRTNLENKEFNFTGWYINMKNRFGWKDKTEVDNTHTFTGAPVISFGDTSKRDDKE